MKIGFMRIMGGANTFCWKNSPYTSKKMWLCTMEWHHLSKQWTDLIASIGNDFMVILKSLKFKVFLYNGLAELSYMTVFLNGRHPPMKAMNAFIVLCYLTWFENVLKGLCIQARKSDLLYKKAYIMSKICLPCKLEVILHFHGCVT